MIQEWSKNNRLVTLVDIWDIFTNEARIIPLFGHIVSSNRLVSVQSIPCVAESVIGSLMRMSQESKDPIKIVINNTGGDVNDGFAIIQAMEHVKAKGIEVWTINLCQAASMATIILMMGTRNRRFVLDNTITHLHSGSKSFSGKVEDVDNLQKFSKKHFTQTLYRWLFEHTKIPEFWNKDSEASYNEEQMGKVAIRVKLLEDFMSGERFLVANEAVEAGIADRVLMPGDPIIDDIFKAVSRGGGSV